MKLQELTPEARILIFGWMRDSIIFGVKKKVDTISYWLFCQGRSKDGIGEDKPFNPDTVWSHLKPHEQQHFSRVAQTIGYLDSLIKAEQPCFPALIEKEEDDHDSPR